MLTGCVSATPDVFVYKKLFNQILQLNKRGHFYLVKMFAHGALEIVSAIIIIINPRHNE